VSVGLRVDTRATLCEPVEVEVNGVTLRVRPVTLKTLKETQRVIADMRAGSADAIASGLGALFEGELAVLDDLPMDKLVEIIEFAVQSATTKPKDAGKNSVGPESKS
jgi:hypothetical protein